MPATPSGLATTICVPVLLTIGTNLLPKYTAVAPSRFVPVIVTAVPPANGPALGLTPATVGAGPDVTSRWITSGVVGEVDRQDQL